MANPIAQASARASITCEDDHPLARATFPTPSQDHTRIYLVCGCGRRRWVWAAEWEAELHRRKEATRG